MIAKQRYRRIPLGELKAHPKNPRRHDVDAIHESIQSNGFVGAIIVQKSTGYVLAGHGRLEALHRELEIDETVPIIEVDADDETALRILLADNRTSDRAGYHDEELLELLRGLGAEHGLSGTGYDYNDFRALEREQAKLNPAAPPEFPEIDPDLETDYCCPRCRYEWSGSPKP